MPRRMVALRDLRASAIGFLAKRTKSQYRTALFSSIAPNGTGVPIGRHKMLGSTSSCSPKKP